MCRTWRKKLGIKLPEKTEGLTPVMHDFKVLQEVGHHHSLQVHGSEAEAAKRAIKYEGIQDKTIFMSYFNKRLPHKSADRMHLLADFLGFDFNTIMFSFTESDCGNPSLMCHLYGLIAEQAYGKQGMTYADGVRLYANNHAIPIMKEKGFPDKLVEIMRRRYLTDSALEETRRGVEEFAAYTYGLTPENMVAMVYAPFTQTNHGANPYRDNLRRYLNYLVETGKPDGHSLQAAEGKICDILATYDELTPEQAPLAARLQELTGLNLNQMRFLSRVGLAVNNFDVKHRSDSATEKLSATMELDSYVRSHDDEIGGKKIARVTSGR